MVVRGRLPIAAAAFAAGVAVASAAFWLGRPSPEPEPAPEEAGRPAPRAEAVPSAPPAPPPPESARSAGRSAEAEPGEGAETSAERAGREPAPRRVRHPKDPALVGEGERLSAVPHQLLGAWDDTPDAEEEAEAREAAGEHRTFVLVVEPSITDRRLESLARDVARAHGDADRLDVRIYDSADAATGSRQLDGGARARAHLVARVVRHRGLGVETLRVRGERLEL